MKRYFPSLFAPKLRAAFGCLFTLLFSLFTFQLARAQELNCTVKIIHTQVQGTNSSVFETLEEAIREFLNNRAWTENQYTETERIDCTLQFTITQYDQSSDAFSGELLLQLSRPVFNSSYNTVVFAMKDENVDFTYKEYDPLEWNINIMTDNLTALLAYYAYLFIGLDMDTFAPLAGTEVLRQVETIVNNAQSLSATGWKAFDDDRNRHAIINDYMESSMEPFRTMMYNYHRLGLDQMADNADRGRTNITEALQLLKEAHENRPLSALPQIFTDYKRDEIVNIYKGHGTDSQKNDVYDIVSDLNASQNTYWTNIKK